MKTIFVTRHVGARDWARRNGFADVDVVGHFVLPDEPCRVIGTLPVHIAAAVCRRGGEYWHLTLYVPAEMRGRDLTAEEMEALGAHVERFEVWPHAEGR